jgi:hypothetical protein
VCSFFKCKYFKSGSKNHLTPSRETKINPEIVKAAGDELRHAYQILSQADEEDMVDYAVFTVNAAEKRYGYLLKKLKEQEKRELLGIEGGEF